MAERPTAVRSISAEQPLVPRDEFVVGPLRYNVSYSYYGVHNECWKDGSVYCQEVYVPSVPSAIGAAETLPAALHDASRMLTIMLKEMQDRGDPMPPQLSEGRVHEIGQQDAMESVAGFDSRFCGVVVVRSWGRPVPELPKEELAKLEAETRAIICSREEHMS